MSRSSISMLTAAHESGELSRRRVRGFVLQEGLSLQRALERLVLADAADLYQRLEVLIQALHAVAGPGLDCRRQLMDLVLADHVAHGRRGYHDFQRRHAPLAVEGRNQRLRDDPQQRLGELDADLFLLMRWERSEERRVG